MTESHLHLTAESFVEQKFDLPEGGRWHELVAGEIVALQPPDDLHGTIVLNLSKTVAAHLDPESPGYACFELGLIVGRNPDTVRCPPMSYFAEGLRFAAMDQEVTETRPALVAEIASTADRRREMPARVAGYLAWGVPQVWVIEPSARQVLIHAPDMPTQSLTANQDLAADPTIPGFRMPVADLFLLPDWWR